MKIRISYEFCTDGDYSLKECNHFGGKEINDEYYVGEKIFENEDNWKCKNEAISFLEEIMCDGLHISYTHYWLLGEFYYIIESLIKFIDRHDKGDFYEEINGNYSDTFIKIEFI